MTKYKCELCEGNVYKGTLREVRGHIQGSNKGEHKGHSFADAEHHMSEIESPDIPESGSEDTGNTEESDPVMGEGPPEPNTLKLPCMCKGSGYTEGEPSVGDYYQCETCDKVYVLEKSTPDKDMWKIVDK